MSDRILLEAVIIGSGFGGAVACCRLAQKWPGQVMLLERGKRYPKGSFPRTPHSFANNFWSTVNNSEKRAKQRMDGLFDIRNYRRMDAVVSAGLGGGSLIYANVFLEPPDWVFSADWPKPLSRDYLQTYYAVSKSVLGARPIPSAENDPRRQITRQQLFADFASADGRNSRLADICVFFGNDHHTPLGIGEQSKNRYGATQTSCTYCGECDVGCNVHAKNTLDLNYLYAAEHHHAAIIRTNCIAEKITPLDIDGQEDSTANGQHGYRVDYHDANSQPQSVFSRRVVVSAGTLGTNELLLRCRDEYGSLPRLSQRLGQRFSGNGDFVSIVAEGKRAADPNYGPVITQYIDYGLNDRPDKETAFILEDAAYPAFAAWYVEGLRPTMNPLHLLGKAWRLLGLFWRRLVQSLLNGKWSGSIVGYFNSLLRGDISFHSNILLFMGRDKSDGVLSLKHGQLYLDWPQTASRPLYEAMIACGKRFKDFVHSGTHIPQPTWAWPIRNNITVHPLGGCALAESASKGVVSSLEANRGQVFGYQGLYVADGSLFPGAVGANPSATIAALSEWIAEGITGIKPDDSLGVALHA